MDVWTLEEKLKQSKTEISELKSRIEHMEEYLGKLTEVKKKSGLDNEAVRSKKKSSFSL